MDFGFFPYRDEPTASLIESSGFCASAVCLWFVEDVVWLPDITAEYFPLADLNNSELITELFPIWILDVCTRDPILNECYILQVSVVFLESSILEGRKCSACQHNTHNKHNMTWRATANLLGHPFPVLLWCVWGFLPGCNCSHLFPISLCVLCLGFPAVLGQSVSWEPCPVSKKILVTISRECFFLFGSIANKVQYTSSILLPHVMRWKSWTLVSQS